MVTPVVNYRAELEKLQPEEREKYTSTWRDYLGGLPKGAYIGELTRLTRQFGPEFTSGLIQPGLAPEKPTAPPITELPAAKIEPEIPWYAKPVSWAMEQPALKPAFKGLERYRKSWLTPAAMTIAQTYSGLYSPELKKGMAGRRPFDIPEEEREEIWDKADLPWLAKIAPELAVDPMMYFGWGLAPKAMRAAEKAGMKGVAQAIKPMANLETAYIKASGAPIRAIGRGLKKIPEIPLGTWAGKPRKVGALFQESPRSMVNNEPLHTFDLLRNLDAAGGQIGKPLSQTIQDIRMGAVDPAITATITNPKQKAVLARLIAHRDELDLDVISRVIDSYPERASVVLARRATSLLAKELGQTVPAKQLGAIQLSKDVYGTWKRTVLSTPWYVEQNIVENFIRPIMVGTNPLKDINVITASPIFKRWPIDMQRRALTFAQRWKQEIPENLKWARSVSTGGLTESMSGALATGKKWPTLTAGATLDEQAMLRTFDSMYEGFERELMAKTSVKTAQALAQMDALWDNAAGLNFPAPTVVGTGTPYVATVYRGVKPGVAPVDSGLFGKGAYYTSNLNYAKTYGEVSSIKVTLNNPRVISSQAEADTFWGAYRKMKQDAILQGKTVVEADDLVSKAMRHDLEVAGHDGLIARNIIETGDEVVVFHPKKFDIQVEPQLLEHLKQASISGSTDDVLAAFAEVQRNKTMTIAKAITEAEKGLPDMIRSGIREELPRLWARNDVHGIEQLFKRFELSLPQQVQAYQKQALLQRLSYFKKLIRQEVPTQYRPLYNQILNRFKYERVADREARLTAAKSLSEFESAMFNANLESMREMESLILGNVITDSIATRQYGKIATYLGIHEQIVQAAFRAGDDLTAKTFSLSKTIKFGKDPKAIQRHWDEYIMGIQSEFPDQATILMGSTPDADLLWSTRRGIQDRRWFKVSQDELAAMQMDPNKIPKMVGADGKLLTMEDYMGKQKLALASWKDRAVDAFGKRHEVPTAAPTPVKWSQEWQEKQVTSEISQYAAASGKGLLYHGGPEITGKTITSGYLTANIDEAVEYAVQFSRTGELGEGFVYVIDKSKANVGRSHIPNLPENLELLSPVKYDKAFDVAKVYKAQVTPAKMTKNQLLDNLRDETIRIKEGVALQELKLQNEAMDMALDVTYDTFGNYGVRTNLDDIMQGIGMPFWFFPSRSIPFYARQMIQKPKLGTEIMTMQSQAEESNLPTRLHGFLPIPGTDYYYNPLAASMLWQLAGQYDWSPQHLGGLEQGQLQMQQKLGMSFGPQWTIATALVSRLMTKQGGAPLVVGDPKYVIPQHRWLEAVENLDLPGLSQIAGIVSEPFDAYLRAVFGSEVAEWQKREVEKYIVDMGHNPQDAPKEVIQDAWNKYWTRQLLSIPGGIVKELTPTEKARFDMMGQKAKELGLTKKDISGLRRAGESPWTGLRQDQLETLFADIPAQKLSRFIRPLGLTSESRPIWEDYIQLKVERETLRGDPENPQEGSRIYKEMQFDAALRSGRISPRAWKSLYRQNYSDYISKIEALELAYPQAPKTEEDWNAYRDLLGWDEPVRHPDDIKLDEYYTVMESSNFENDIGEFDYDTYRKAEAAFFQGVSPDTVTYIMSKKDRYKTPTRAAYTRDMRAVQPYYDLQDSILAQYPPEIAQVIEYALASPDPAIQRAILIGRPEAMIALRRVRLAKRQLRARNPEMDKILRFWSS